MFWLKDWKDEEIARLNKVIEMLMQHIKEIRDIVVNINKETKLRVIHPEK